MHAPQMVMDLMYYCNTMEVLDKKSRGPAAVTLAPGAFVQSTNSNSITLKNTMNRQLTWLGWFYEGTLWGFGRFVITAIVL